jgi:hypothetical protein
MPHLSFIIAALAENISSITMCESVSKSSIVIRAILEKELPYSMRFIILPLASIDGV